MLSPERTRFKKVYKIKRESLYIPSSETELEVIMYTCLIFEENTKFKLVAGILRHIRNINIFIKYVEYQVKLPTTTRIGNSINNNN